MRKSSTPRKRRALKKSTRAKLRPPKSERISLTMKGKVIGEGRISEEPESYLSFGGRLLPVFTFDVGDKPEDSVLDAEFITEGGCNA